LGDQGAELGADLYKLLVVAKDNLPSVAAEYRAKAELDRLRQTVGEPKPDQG
jgi:hypothetical protein